MLGVAGKLAHKVEGDVLTVAMPDLAPDGAPCRHAYAIKITGAEVVSEI
jgi:hypothetical protein